MSEFHQSGSGDVAQQAPSVATESPAQAQAAPSLFSTATASFGRGVLQRKIAARLARKATGQGQGQGLDGSPEAAVGQAASDSGAPVDDSMRARVEQATGKDLSAVRVHTGPASHAAAEAVGARAYATGQDVHFGQGEYQPGTPGGDHLIAHELAHTVQQQSSSGPGPAGGGGGSQFKLEVSEPGDAAEVEADRVADAVVHGAAHAVAPVAMSAVPSTVAREAVAGNPQNLTNAAGNATTTHAAPTINDAINHQAPAAAGNQPGAKNVKVVATEAAALSVGPFVCPRTDLIYQESPAAVSPAPSGFTTVSGLHGTVDAPMIEHVADNSIFINGQPSPNDVQQMGIGDCYFLALTMSVAQRDPGKIKTMMTPDGSGGASVTFFRKQVTQPNGFMAFFGAGPTISYVPVTVAVTNDLSYDLNMTAPLGSGQRAANGQPAGFQLHGAQLRCANQPKDAKYWSKLDGGNLEVHRRDTFECARWSPLLEKAYARFSEVNGQYGGSHGDTAGGSGYANINGGWSQNSMFVFYGHDADQANGNAGGVSQQATNWAPGSQAVAANPQAVDALLRLQGRGEARQPTDTNAPIVTATSMVYLLIPRLLSALTAAQGDADYANLTPVTTTNLAAVATAINTYNATPNDPPNTQGPKAAARSAIGTACSTAILPANAADLFNAARSKPIKDMLELAADLKNIGTDKSPGQRNIYGDHVYSVVGASFVTTTSQPVPLQTLSMAQRVPFYPLVDAFVSSVRLRNPHHNNEPDMQGNNTPTNAGDGAPTGAAADGIFTMNLDQFFRNYTSVESGVFPRT